VSVMRSKKTSDLTQFYAAQELLNRGHGRLATAVRLARGAEGARANEVIATLQCRREPRRRIGPALSRSVEECLADQRQVPRWACMGS
jgi:hypothetical protein